ncbi:hypothetical protein ACFP2F_18835 [Hymenobacter artigasi]|uniref:Uncharacterized membrane protein YhaH (DUF805 family) n=1 Tax=Hymenobacter artigasi TaxID=2719616 RepID=A0ABX1HKT7_9BACT|nr:hypothetical protein [Hymenobacter artigasi]NKI90889.1 uncharacterized membrane protein YhaH (DUF805 family) [Hymenobacter artigasi]
MFIPSLRLIETALRSYLGLLVLFAAGGILIKISAFYEFQPDHIGPYNIPFLDAQLLALGYMLLPFVGTVLAALAAFGRRPLAYAGILFFHLLFWVVPIISLVIRTHRPRALVVENWLSIAVMTAALYLLTTPAVRTYFALSNEHSVRLYQYTALTAFGYAVLGFIF